MQNFFSKIFLYLKRENRLLSVTLGVLLLFSLGTYALASFYPGETNDPNCAPGDSGCYVDVLPSQSGHSGHVLTTDGTTATWSSVSGSGTVTDITVGNLSPLFTSSVATSTSTPAVTFSLSSAGSYTILGNNTGSSAAPTYFTPTLASALFANQGTATTVLHGNASGSPTWGALNLATDVTGTLPATNGGTGLTSYGTGSQLLGMNSGGTALEYKTLGGDATLSGSTLTIANDAITTAKIINNAVTYAKMQAVSTTSKLLGSSSTTTAVQEITLGSGLSMSGTTLSNSGVVSIGAMDGTTKDATNGLVISSGVLYAQSADITNPGLVSIAAQTFNGIKTFDDGLDAGGDRITSVGTPSSSTDAANKAYVDGLVSGLNWKVSVNAATATTLPSYTYNNGASGVGAYLEGSVNGALGTIDGVTLVVSDRLLVKNETGVNEPYNGVYIVTTVGDGSTKYKLTRCTSCDEAAEFSNAAVAVLAGTANTGTAWTQTNTITTVGTDAVAWVQFLSNAYSEGAGIDITSGVISVDFSTVSGTLGATHGGTGLTSYGTGSQLLGMNSGGTALEYKTLGGDATLSGSTLTIANDAITTAKIINNAVTYAKMQAVSTTSKLLGSSSTTTAVQEITLGSGLSLSGTTLTATGTGTVTSFSAGDLSPLFTTSEATATSTPALSFTLSNAAAYTILGNNSGSSTTPSYFTPTLASALFANQGTTTQVLHGNASGSPTWGAISLSADVSGTLPLANGGTGQTSKIPAFDALSPMSASGDIIYGGASGTGTRLPKGTDGQCLLLSSGLPSWGTCASGGSGVSGLLSIGSSPNANGASISGVNLMLQPASALFGGVVTTGTQTIAGVKTFSSNLKIGTGTDLIVAGYGAGSPTTNTAFGVTAGNSQNSTSSYNNWFGYQAGLNVTSGTGNVGIGLNAGNGDTTGSFNVAVGDKALSGTGVTPGLIAENTAVGASAGSKLYGGHYNLLLGAVAGFNLTTGSRNIVLTTHNSSTYGAIALTTGDANVYIGGWNGMSGTDTGKLALSNGTGSLVMYSDGTNTSFGGDLTPNNILSVGSLSQFQVSSTGAIAAATGITSSGTMTFSGLVSCAGLQTNGSGVVSCTSDSNYKDIQSDFTAGLDALMNIHPKTFTWKEGTYLYDGGVRYSGFIAQDVQSAFPEGVTIGSRGELQLSTTAVLAATVNAVKDLNLKFTPLTSIDVNQNNSLAHLIVQFLNDAVVTIKEATISTLRVNDKVCVDDVCVTKEQFKQILINGGGVTPAPSTPPENSGLSGGSGSSSEDSSTTDTENEDVQNEPSAEENTNTNVEEVVVVDESTVNSEENDVPAEDPVASDAPDTEIVTPQAEEAPAVE